MCGYLHRKYAESLSEFGQPVYLPNCEGWILKRRIPGTEYYDAMGCYPLFMCKDWSKLHLDLESIKEEIICISIVTGPFVEPNKLDLKSCFADVLIPFKKHYTTLLSQPIEGYASKHHLRYSSRSLRHIKVKQSLGTDRALADWNDIYSNLIKRHNLSGIHAFSTDSFKKQFKVPGLIIFTALCDNKTVGMILWYVQNKIGYYHLGAYTDLGYELRASFGLFRHSIEYFQEMGLTSLNLGSGAGIKASEADGLSRFKKGWSNEIRTSFFLRKNI